MRFRYEILRSAGSNIRAALSKSKALPEFGFATAFGNCSAATGRPAEPVHIRKPVRRRFVLRLLRTT